MSRLAVSLAGLLLPALAAAAEQPDTKVQVQPARWRAIRQVTQQCAEQAGFRGAMPATLSRRAFLGSTDGRAGPVAEVIRNLCEQTGLVWEVRQGVIRRKAQGLRH